MWSPRRRYRIRFPRNDNTDEVPHPTSIVNTRVLENTIIYIYRCVCVCVCIDIPQYTSYILLTPFRHKNRTSTIRGCYILLVLSLLTIMWCRICSLSVTTSLAFLCRRVTRARRRFILNTHTPIINDVNPWYRSRRVSSTITTII